MNGHQQRWRGVLWLCLVAISLAIHVWLTASRLLPLATPERVEYVFTSAPFGTFLAATLSAFVLVFLGHGLIRRLDTGRDAPRLFDRDDLQYWTPMLWFAVSLLGLLALVPGVGTRLSAWLFVIIDLRWWWTPIVVAWFVARVDARLHGRLRRFARRRASSVSGFASSWVWGLSLAGVVVAWAVATTPMLRFSAALHGDEPKYLRYCESFYQGVGFELTSQVPMAELPPDFRPRPWRNLTLLAQTVPRELGELVGDAVRFLREPGRRFNRATYLEAWFITGKNGGLYQVHTPGLSFLIFPAYYIDRAFVRAEPGYQEQIPAELPAVNLMFLVLYGVWGVTIYRFLSHLVERRDVAWGAAAAALLTLPVVSIPFQFYPETAGGLVLFLVLDHLLFSRRRSVSAALAMGALTAYLPWLHVRFLAMSVVLLMAAAWQWRRDRGRVLAFLAGYGALLACFCLYAYRLTGSILPTAMYNPVGSPPDNMLRLSEVRWGLPAALLDRVWGLLPYAPIYLLAVPGFWWLWRQRRDVAVLIAALIASVAVPSAGHGFTAGGGSPLRHLVAVVPLAAAPLALAWLRLGGRRVWQVVTAVLLLASVQNGAAYDWNHLKHVGPMVDWSVSGWKTNLLFPLMHRYPYDYSWGNLALVLGWTAALVAAILAPALAGRRGLRAPPRPMASASVSLARPVAATVVSLCALGSAASATTGDWVSRDYLMPADVAALGAASYLDDIDHCAICLLSTRGRTSTGTLMARLEAISDAVAERPNPPGVRPYDEWLEMPRLIREWYRDATGHEPADGDFGHHLYQWREEHVRPSEIRRRIYEAAGRPAPQDSVR